MYFSRHVGTKLPLKIRYLVFCRYRDTIVNFIYESLKGFYRKLCFVAFYVVCDVDSLCIADRESAELSQEPNNLVENDLPSPYGM